MSTKTFIQYIRVANVLTNATSVKLRVKDNTNNIYVISTSSTFTNMDHINTGIYQYISDDIFLDSINYTVTYEVVLSGNTYTFSEDFTTNTPINKLFTLEELKQQLNISTTAYDLELNLLVDAVPALFESYLNRKIGIGLNSEDYYNQTTIFVNAFPITNVESVSINGSTTTFTILDANIGQLKIDDSLSDGDKITIIYNGGLPISSDYKLAGLYQAKYMYQRHQHQHVAIDENIKEQGRIIYRNEDILPLVKIILEPQIRR